MAVDMSQTVNYQYFKVTRRNSKNASHQWKRVLEINKTSIYSTHKVGGNK